MKKSSISLLDKLSQTQLEDLTIEVKETIASGILSTNSRVFTPAELWNIQRNGRNRPQRRFL